MRKWYDCDYDKGNIFVVIIQYLQIYIKYFYKKIVQNELQQHIWSDNESFKCVLLPYSHLMLKNWYAYRYFGFKYYGFERTWWRLLQKRVVRTKFDIYVFIVIESNMVFIPLTF
jgi:hypothetical protein